MSEVFFFFTEKNIKSESRQNNASKT